MRSSAPNARKLFVANGDENRRRVRPAVALINQRFHVIDKRFADHPEAIFDVLEGDGHLPSSSSQQPVGAQGTLFRW